MFLLNAGIVLSLIYEANALRYIVQDISIKEKESSEEKNTLMTVGLIYAITNIALLCNSTTFYAGLVILIVGILNTIFKFDKEKKILDSVCCMTCLVYCLFLNVILK
jgi:uncharacterized membrane protein HdeD (DUF308 family)